MSNLECGKCGRTTYWCECHSLTVHVPSERAELVPGPVVRVKCDQNRLFSCGAMVQVQTYQTPYGADRIGLVGGANCPCCLPVAYVGDLVDGRAVRR
jgi:hypothetical protein